MTTIAYRNGLLVADTCISLGDVRVGAATKLYSVNGHCVGSAGSRSEISPFLKWLKDGADMSCVPLFKDDKDSCFSAIVINKGAPHQLQYFWTTDKGNLVIDDIDAEYFAVGSGKFIAIGAMAHGASALDAVLCAIKHDAYTGGPAEVMHCADGTLERAS